MCIFQKMFLVSFIFELSAGGLLALGVWTCLCNYFTFDASAVWLLLTCVCEQIAHISGATVATRGRYLPDDELNWAEPGYVLL